MSSRPKRVKPERDPVQIWIDELVAEGAKASSARQCPYSASDPFRFCAWMAGFNDRQRERMA